MPGSDTNNQPRIVIIAAGDATRWANYMGVPKHYAVINGEPIIERIVRLLVERGQHDIWVVSKGYKIRGVQHYRPTLNKDNHDADKFISSSDLWHKRKRTIVLYGDVYFTENALDTILADENQLYRLFCRPTGNKAFGYPYGECFALSFYPVDHEFIRYCLQRLVHLYRADVISRIGGWELTRLMANVPIGQMEKHKTKLSNYIVINDQTNDIDYPSDYENVKKAVEQ